MQFFLALAFVSQAVAFLNSGEYYWYTSLVNSTWSCISFDPLNLIIMITSNIQVQHAPWSGRPHCQWRWTSLRLLLPWLQHLFPFQCLLTMYVVVCKVILLVSYRWSSLHYHLWYVGYYVHIACIEWSHLRCLSSSPTRYFRACYFPDRSLHSKWGS